MNVRGKSTQSRIAGTRSDQAGRESISSRRKSIEDKGLGSPGSNVSSATGPAILSALGEIVQGSGLMKRPGVE